MIQKGKLNLVNHTVYDWIKTYQSNSEMVMSKFPEIIPAKSSVEIEMEWTEQKTDGSGKINYMLFGSRDRSFQIHASSKEEGLQIRFLNIMTPDHPVGSILHIGLNRRGAASFALTGMADEFEIANVQ